MALSEVEGRSRRAKSKGQIGGYMGAWFYILRLKSGQLYIGSTRNLQERYKAHYAGKACRTTKFDPPVALLNSETYNTFSEARKREAQVKRWTRVKKEALVKGDIETLRNS
jgi:putative endonuclease